MTENEKRIAKRLSASGKTCREIGDILGRSKTAAFQAIHVQPNVETLHTPPLPHRRANHHEIELKRLFVTRYTSAPPPTVPRVSSFFRFVESNARRLPNARALRAAGCKTRVSPSFCAMVYALRAPSSRWFSVFVESATKRRAKKKMSPRAIERFLGHLERLQKRAAGR